MKNIKPNEPCKQLEAKNLEELENDHWGDPGYNSYLVKRCHELRKIPLGNFTTEDLRIMIGQQIGLPYLVPLALEVLTIDLFAEGDFFEGDLLKNMLAIDTGFWKSNKPHWATLNNLLAQNRSEIIARNFGTNTFDQCY